MQSELQQLVTEESTDAISISEIFLTENNDASAFGNVTELSDYNIFGLVCTGGAVRSQLSGTNSNVSS